MVMCKYTDIRLIPMTVNKIHMDFIYSILMQKTKREVEKMKLKTKIMMLLIAVLVVGSTMSIFAAEKAKLTASVTGNTAKNGEITVAIKAENISNLGGTEIELTYDNTKLSYVDGTISEAFKSSASEVVDMGTSVKITTMYTDAVNSNGTVAEIKFKVLADGGQDVQFDLTATLIDIDSYDEIDNDTDGTSFTVKIPITGVAIEGKTINLSVAKVPTDATENISAVVWKSGDESVVKVDSNGVVTALKPGKVKITATSGNYTDEIEIEVTAAKQQGTSGGDTNGASDNNINSGNTNGASDNNINSGNTNGALDNNVNSGNTNGASDNNINSGNTNGTIEKSPNTGDNFIGGVFAIMLVASVVAVCGIGIRKHVYN